MIITGGNEEEKDGRKVEIRERWREERKKICSIDRLQYM
jgi:hypothetical protein